jgi:hypothetical protein
MIARDDREADPSQGTLCAKPAAVSAHGRA